ncbi:MAG: sulfatase [Planctomycetota bacterium]
MFRATAPLFALLAACGDPPSTQESADGEADDRVALVGGEVPRGVVAGTPNVLIVTIDTLRADHLGFHGYTAGTSPFLDGLAEESVVFDRVYAPVATTLPSHTTMFTGVLPLEHGVLANIADGRTYKRREDLVTLAELFEAAGYSTDAIVSAYPLRAEFGLDTGFERYSSPPRRQRIASATTDAAQAAMADQIERRKPGFLWLHYFDPHGPYNPPSEVLDLFDVMSTERADELRARGFAERAQRPTGQWNILETGIRAYDAEIRFVDQELARLFESAAASGWMADDTVVLIAADHGEGLNQHGVPGHGLVWEEHLHVPMLLRAKGVAPRRLPGPASLADLAPTLLHVLDLPGTDAFLEQVTGVNRFAPTVSHADLRILAHTSPRLAEGEDLGFSLRAGKWKLHRDAGGEASLYDLDADPDELTDIAAEQPDVVAKLAAELDAQLARARGEVRTEEASDDARSALESLGYGGAGR